MQASKLTLLAAAVLASHVGAMASNAALLLGTNFDGRTLTTTNVANDTATNITWTTNGLQDPGDMNVLRNGVTGNALFNGNALTQNNFAPAINVGNDNAFWTTDVALVVATGNAVTLTDVTFNYIAISAGQALNVNRRSDFTVEVFDPSLLSLGSFSINEAVSGTTAVPQTPTLTFTFAAPIDLTLPGSYTLRIKAGDFAGQDETGNHTGIDNLAINGRVTAIASVPEPTTASLGLIALGGLLMRRRRTT